MSSMPLWGLPLQIQRKGNFYNDTSFENDRSYFESAANDLLKEFDFGGKKEDSFTSYRRLRDRQLSGTDRTAKLAEEDDKYKIVMDVEGFGDADLQVKVLGPNSICIEANQEIKQGGTVSKKSFRRRFSLPNLALVEDASSSLSSDNVLTVNIPKKIIEIKDTKEKETTTTSNISQHVDNLQEEIDKSFRDLKTCSFFGKSNVASDTKTEESSELNRRFNLPIVSKESFFNDSFFENDRNVFQKSIQDILEKRNTRIGSQSDVFSKVREVKQEDVQAVSVLDEEHQHKIVIDIHGYAGEDLKVNAVNANELSVEGCTQKTSKYTNCCNSFKRNFTLPSDVNIREATSAVSSDGILTILIPKNKAIPQNFSIPVLTEGVNQRKMTTEDIKTTKTEHLNTTANKQNEQVVEQVVNSKVFGEDKQQNTTCNVVGQKVEQFIPINLEDSKQNTQVQNTTIHSQQQKKIVEQQTKSVDKEIHLPIMLDNKATTEKVVQQQSCTQKQDIRSNVECKTPTAVSQAPKSNDREVPISYKGSLYNDSIFEDTRKNFEKETQHALNSFKGIVDVPTNQNKVLLRSQSTISDDATNYKIVLDVFGYEEHELKIKLSGVNEIYIEGISEKNSGGTMSKKSFYRSFQLPSYVDLERASTALSSEGILTIAIPKKNQVILKTDNVTPITSQLDKANEEKTTLVIDVTGVVKDKKIEKKFDFGNSSTTTINTTSSISKQTSDAQEVNLPSRIEEFSDTSSVASIRDLQREESQTSNVSSQTIVPASTVSTMNLSIVPKGNFFDDTFFQDSRSTFESALRNQMNRFNKSSSFVDDLGFYKSLRERRITDGSNQTGTITEDEQVTKIVLDVDGFDVNSLTIKFDGKNEITIEGSQEEKTGNSMCKKRFRRSFFLSHGMDVNNVTSALSSDGVLSIKVPKLSTKQLQN